MADTAISFDRCADAILDSVEEAFGVKSKMGREISKRAIINMLVHFCIPREGDLSVKDLTEQLRVRGVFLS